MPLGNTTLNCVVIGAAMPNRGSGPIVVDVPSGGGTIAGAPDVEVVATVVEVEPMDVVVSGTEVATPCGS